MTFGFGDGFAQTDVTPVDNEFILEYLPMAKENYVRIYLYGLMCCYHPELGITPEDMAGKLDLPEEDIHRAYRYWERRGLVTRVSDDPPSWKYLNPRGRGREAAGRMLDPEYEAFKENLQDAFDGGGLRELHGGEIQTCYEWVTELKIAPEAVIMLLLHVQKTKGRHFSIQSAEKLAVQMAEENARTHEAAAEFLSRDQDIYEGTKKILTRLGKRNAPSQDQLAMYRKWRREWGFTHEAIADACAETAKGDPNMGYLDGVLRKIRGRSGDGVLDEDRVRLDRERTEGLRALTDVMGQGSINDATLDWYDRMRGEYPQEMLILAARECARTGGKTQDMEKMLRSWQARGITTTEEAEQYIADFRAQSELLLALRRKWGLQGRMGEKDRALLRAWTGDLGFSPEMILFTADYASDSDKPMAYLDKILRDYAGRDIRTPEAAARDREAYRAAREEPKDTAGKPGAAGKPGGSAAKAVPAQQYTQRDYSTPQETIEEMMTRLNGGVRPDN